MKHKNYNQMARPKLGISKSVYLRCRVEPNIKKKFEVFCKKNKISPAKHLREIILKELENEK
jgi:hypothetical protein